MSRSSDNAMPVTPGLVTWARERAGYSIAEAAEHFKKIEEWERSKSRPSYQQLERMADRFKCPVAVFFFPEPPALPPIAETFRTLPEAELSRIPREVKQLLRKAKAMQLALAELTEGRNPAPRLITRDLRFAEDVSPTEMASRVREYLGVDVETQAAWESVEDALEKWRGLVNEAGGVCIQGCVQTKGLTLVSVWRTVSFRSCMSTTRRQRLDRSSRSFTNSDICSSTRAEFTS